MRYTWILIVLLIVTAGIMALSFLRHRGKGDKKKGRTVLLSHTRKIKQLPAYAAARRRYRVLLILASLFFIVSIVSVSVLAARPTSVVANDYDYESRDIMLCIDVSGSMTTELDAVMNQYITILDRFKGERIGVTIFATYSALMVPLTNDYDALGEVLSEIRSNYQTPYRLTEDGMYYSYFYNPLVGAGSFIGDGVINCINNMGNLDAEGRSQSVIVATDNVQTKPSDNPEIDQPIADITQAAKYAKSHNVTMYGINTNNGLDTGHEAGSFRRAVALTGGLYFNAYSGSTEREHNANFIVKSILDDEAALHTGAKQLVVKDTPEIVAIIALIAVAIMGILLWRLNL